MVKSMTGFGRAQAENEDFKVTVEVKAVNHRYLECSLRLPKSLQYLEAEFKKEIGRVIKRGRIECTFSIEGAPTAKKALEIDWELLDHYYRFLKQAEARYEFDEQPKFSDLLLKPDFIEVKENADVQPVLASILTKALEKAINRLDEMRQTEGLELLLHFKQHQETLTSDLAFIKKSVPAVREHYEEKLRTRLNQIAGTNFDQAMLLSELAILLEKADINEEIERLASHLKQFAAIILKEEPIGRKLDFLLQEMNREVNTIGSKAQSIKITERVVEMKTTLEKIREQVQNVE